MSMANCVFCEYLTILYTLEKTFICMVHLYAFCSMRAFRLQGLAAFLLPFDAFNFGARAPSASAECDGKESWPP